MTKNEIIAITFSEKEGAEQMFKTLRQSAPVDFRATSDAVVVVKDEAGKLTAKNMTDRSKNMVTIGPSGFVASFLLGGAIANTLLGEAAGTLLAHRVDLGIPDHVIAELSHHLVAGSSILFVYNHISLNGSFQRVFDRSGGQLHHLHITPQAATEVKIMASTLANYWD